METCLARRLPALSPWRVFEKRRSLALVVGYVDLDRLPPYEEASATNRKEYRGVSLNRTRLPAANATQMIPIPILNVDKQGGEYLITVQVACGACPGTFDKLGFEIKPDVGWYHYDWPDPIYHRDPGLKRGRRSGCGGFNSPSHD
jgi:hypothetical protein